MESHVIPEYVTAEDITLKATIFKNDTGKRICVYRSAALVPPISALLCLGTLIPGSKAKQDSA